MSLKPGQGRVARVGQTWERLCPHDLVTAAVLAASLRPSGQILTVPESHLSALKPHKANSVSPEGILVTMWPITYLCRQMCQ